MALPDKILARKLLKKEKKKLKMLQEKAKQEKENPAKDVSGKSRYRYPLIKFTVSF